MSHRKVDFSTFKREIRRELTAGNLAVLVGAGISMLEPSALPSGYALMDLAVAGLCNTPRLRHFLRRARTRSRYRNITPEIVFQDIHASLGEGSLPPFFDLLRHARVNDVHVLLGHWAQAHRCRLFTTNFDTLLEQAGAPRRSVEHLHGVISRPSTMVTRINQVGHGLPPDATSAMRRRLANRTLCVLGYSGNDEDIRQIVSESRVRRVLWLARGRGDWAWQNIPLFAAKHRVLVAHGDLSALPSAWSGLPYPGGVIDAATQGTRLEVVRHWAAVPPLVDRYAFLSELLFALEDWRGALSVSTEGRELARGTELAGWFRIQMADALKMLGRFPEAERRVRSAIRINTALGDPFDIAGAYNNLGTLLVEKAVPEPKRALSPLRRALATIDAVDFRRLARRRREALTILRGRVCNNLGLAYEWLGDSASAIAWYEHSLMAKTAVGDLLGQAKSLGNLSIVFEATADPRAADSRRRALFLMDRYGLTGDKAYLLRRIGGHLCARGEQAAGIALATEALALFQSIPGSQFSIQLTKRLLREYT